MNDRRWLLVEKKSLLRISDRVSSIAELCVRRETEDGVVNDNRQNNRGRELMKQHRFKNFVALFLVFVLVVGLLRERL